MASHSQKETLPRLNMQKFLNYLATHFRSLVIIGFSLQLIIAVTTYQPDLRAFVLANKFIHQGELFTFYDHVSKLPKGDEIKKIFMDDIFIYPPLAYLAPAVIYQPLYSFFAKDIDKLVLFDYKYNSGRPYALSMLFFKAPMLLFSLLFFIFIPHLFDKDKEKKLAQLLWLFNPVNLLVAAGMGQVDVILVFFLLLSLIMIKKERYILASVFIGLSMLIKPIGLILLPILALRQYHKHGLIAALKAALPGFFVYLLGILPYYHSPAFRLYALFADQTSTATFAGIAISPGVNLPWFFISYFFVLILFLKKRLSFINSIGLALFSSLAFNYFHAQWFLWLTPWLIYLAIHEKQYFLYSLLICLWLAIWLTLDVSLNFRLLYLIKPLIADNAKNFLASSLIISAVRAALAASFFYIIFDRQNPHET